MSDSRSSSSNDNPRSKSKDEKTRTTSVLNIEQACQDLGEIKKLMQQFNDNINASILNSATDDNDRKINNAIALSNNTL